MTDTTVFEVKSKDVTVEIIKECDKIKIFNTGYDFISVFFYNGSGYNDAPFRLLSNQSLDSEMNTDRIKINTNKASFVVSFHNG